MTVESEEEETEMPRHGMIVRSTLVFAAAAAVAALAVAIAGAARDKRQGITLDGAGSSLIAPAVQGVWAPAYQSAKGVTVNYASVGSGTGIANITARTVDFGASDAPMTPAQLKACNGCVQVPWALTATAVVVNIPGIHQGELQLSGPVIAKIFLGQITNWSDPAIKALNPGVKLPSEKITVAHRSDGSGDSYVFTNYLSKINPQWHHTVGYGTSVSWPAGVGGKGNSGVAAIIASTNGSIGYVSAAYTIPNHLIMAKVKNASGHFVLPEIKTIEAAAQLVKAQRIPADNHIDITDPPRAVGKATRKYSLAYPLATFTYVIVPIRAPKGSAIKAFVNWAMSAREQKAIQRLVFAPLPPVVTGAASRTLAKIR